VPHQEQRGQQQGPLQQQSPVPPQVPNQHLASHQQHAPQSPPVSSGTSKPKQAGQGLEQHVLAATEQQPAAGAGASSSVEMGKTDKQPASQILQGSSSTAGADDLQMENSEIGLSGAGAMVVTHKESTTKICRRCGVKGHLMFECTVTVFCEICRSNDHAICRCPVLKQLKPVVQLVGQAADALAGFHIPHAPIQPAKKDSRMALVSTSGKNVTGEEIVNFLRVLVSDTFAWEVKRHNGFEFKVLFPSKGDLTKMTKFNAEMKEGVTLKF
jgi:hypothetical protein